MLRPIFQKTYLGIYLISCFSLIYCSKKEIQPESYNGIWQSLGGGWVMAINDDGTYIEYDVTDISCLSARQSHVEEFEDRIAVKGDEISLRRGVLVYTYKKTNKLPSVCEEVVPDERSNDPLYNLEVFANTIENHYAFMDLNNINFERLYHQASEKLVADPTDVTLYSVMNEMLIALNDNHGFIEASEHVYELIESEAQETDEEVEESEIGDFEIAGIVAEHHLDKEFTEDSFLMQWGLIDDNIGYIQIKAMFLYADLGLSDELIDSLGYWGAFSSSMELMNEGAYIEKEGEGASKLMQRVLNDLSSTDAIIIDNRFNGGGQDAVSLNILKYFNSEERIIAYQKLVHKNGYSPEFDVKLEAVANPYLKPTFVLTSRQTGSAAEVFSLATKALPHVYTVGEPTMGALSTSLQKQLPNGWDFAISNEIYESLEGEIYENRGIPVDYPMSLQSEDRQDFFSEVRDNLDQDKIRILETITNALKELK